VPAITLLPHQADVSGPYVSRVISLEWRKKRVSFMPAINVSVLFAVFKLALLAACVATFCDAVHVYTGTLRYPDPVWFGQAAWVFPLFLLAFAAMALAYLVLLHYLRGPLALKLSRSAGSASAMVEAITLFAFCYLLSGFGNESPVFLNWVFYGTLLIRLVFSYERCFMLILATMLGLSGMLAEGLLGSLAMVAYREAEIFHVPWWLGGLYAHGAFALRESMRALVLSEAY
tara:strand:+ start:36531 stop:37223 length:693 start_codon:yes stop_codon:yes gene_type:complete